MQIDFTYGDGKHGAAYGGAAGASSVSPDAVAASMAKGDGGFGREQTSYFEHPVVRKAHWGWEIVWYFYLGGIMNGSGLLSALTDTIGSPEDAALVRNGRYVGLVLAGVSGVLLIADLGRPDRFYTMLRIFKLKSPMSVGVYSLTLFSGAIGLAVLDQLHRDRVLPVNLGGFVPKLVRNLLVALGAGLTASYTGVLISATAIPVWYNGRRHIPAIFVCSAAATSCAFNSALLSLTGGSAETIQKLEKIEILASLAEAALVLDFQMRSKEHGAPLFTGATGKKLKLFTLGLGIAAPVLINFPALFGKRGTAKHHHVKTLLAAGLTLVGGYMMRQTIMDAGKTSADDARATLRAPE